MSSSMTKEDIDKRHTERCHGAAAFKHKKVKLRMAKASRRRNRA